MDLNIMASRFPLLIGVVLAALWIWQARRLTELSATVSVFSKHLCDDVVQLWLRRRLGADSNLARLRTLLIEGAVACAWIGFAAWELAGWRQVNTGQAAILVLLGCAAVGAGLIYRRLAVERAVASLTDPA